MTRLPLLRNSEAKDFRRCPQRWYWGWREGLKPRGAEDVKLWFGTGWHIFLAHHYQAGLKRGRNPLKVWRDWVGEEVVKMRVNVRGEDWREETYIDAGQLGELMIGYYLDLYGKDEHMHILQVEKPFEVIIVDSEGEQRVLLCGTYDGVYVDLRTDFIWLLENKTAKQIRTGHLTMDPQAGTYLMVATRQLTVAGTIPKGKRIRGVMYNFARKAVKDDRPTNADGAYLNKDGTVSKQQPAPLFLRHPVERTRGEVNGELIQIRDTVEAMEEYRAGFLNPFKNRTMDCSWDCSFYNMCVLHGGGTADWEEYKRSQFVVKDPYEDHRKSAEGFD